MDYSKIKIPFLQTDVIQRYVDGFRKKYWDDTVPVHVERILDVALAVNIIPVPELMSQCDTDALITSDWESLYVDKRSFEDERYQNRLRFSLGHELGHYVLHKEIYAGFEVQSYEDVYRLIDKIPESQYQRLETQANLFSSYLLVPRDVLMREARKVIEQAEKGGALEELKVDGELFISYLAQPLSQTFGVSGEAIEIALKNDLLKGNS